MNKSSISIIHPSRSRCEMAMQTIRKWINSADYPQSLEYILSIDKTDPQYLEYTSMRLRLGVPIHIDLVNGDNHSAIEAINRAANYVTNNIIVVVSDDFDCFQGWDTALYNALDGQEDYIVKTQDGTQDWIITLPIMDRAYYSRFEYIYHPDYKHMFVDTHMTHVADLLNRKIVSPLLFKHNHYTVGGMVKDAINEKNDATWEQGERLYLENIKTNFGLKPEDIKGSLSCDQDHINWLANKGIKL